MTQPRAVAQFASAFAPHIGGVEEVARRLASAQRARGERPIVVTMRWPKDLPTAESINGIPVRRHIFRLPEPRPRSLLAYAVDAPRIRRAVANELRSHGASVVHVQCVSGNALYALSAARRLNLPFIVSLHGELTMDADDVYQHSHVLPGLLRRVLREADAVTACSSFVLEEAEEYVGFRLGDRGSVVHSGVDLAELRGAKPERRERPYVLAIGRHVAVKGFDVLLDAYGRLVRQRDDVPDLVVVGDGPERPNLERLAAAQGLHSRVDFVGRCERERTVGLFRDCSMFVLPSRHEPMGIVVLEAMAAARPVVASHVGGVPEIVEDGRTGLLVPPGDAGRLAEAMGRLLSDPVLANDLGHRAAAAVTVFDWSRVAQRFMEVYDDAESRVRNGQ